MEGACEAACPAGGPGVDHGASALHGGWRQPARRRLPWFLPVLPSPVLQGGAAPLWPRTQGPRVPAAEPSTAPTSPSGRALPDMVRHRVLSRPQVRWCGVSGSRTEVKVHQAIIPPRSEWQEKEYKVGRAHTHFGVSWAQVTAWGQRWLLSLSSHHENDACETPESSGNFTSLPWYCVLPDSRSSKAA